MHEAVHTGSCQCGAVRFRISGALPTAYACHCGECKKQSASAFSMSIAIPFQRLEVQGEPAMFSVTGYSGAGKQCFYCPYCGTRMWHRSVHAPENATLKVGTLDNAQDIAPAFHLWISKKQAGIFLDPEVPAYETQPENLFELRERMSGPGGPV